MQKVRGFVYFEEKTIDEVKSAFDGFKLDNIELAFFGSLSRYGQQISSPGVFITRSVDDSYSSKDVVSILRKQMGLEEELKGCDVSIESEDTLKSLAKGARKGEYIGIRIKPPHELNKIYDISSRVGKLIDAQGIFVRTVESVKEGNALVCMDLITEDDFEEKRKEAEDIISSEGLNLGKYTHFSFV